MPNEGEVANQNVNQQQTSISVESQIVNAESQNAGNAHSNSKNNTHEGNEELCDGDMHEDSNGERNDMETRKEPRLKKYVRRHHLAE